MDDIERIGREINAEHNNEQTVPTPSSETEIRNSSGSFVVLENSTGVSSDLSSDDEKNTLDSFDEKNTLDSFDEIQLPMKYLPNSTIDDSLITYAKKNAQDLQSHVISVAGDSSQNTNDSSANQPQPNLAPQPPTTKNQERFGRLTGVVITNGPNLNYEVGIGNRNRLYITNHDPGHVQPLPPHISHLQFQTDVISCTLPFKYGICFTFLVIIVNFISFAYALFNYNECGGSYVSLPLYVAVSSIFYITRSIHDIIVYYFDCCWDIIRICGRPINGIRSTETYEYHNLFGLILNMFLPILDTIVGVIFLITFYNVCSRQIWLFTLLYIIICYPLRSIKMH